MTPGAARTRRGQKGRAAFLCLLLPSLRPETRAGRRTCIQVRRLAFCLRLRPSGPCPLFWPPPPPLAEAWAQGRPSPPQAVLGDQLPAGHRVGDAAAAGLLSVALHIHPIAGAAHQTTGPLDTAAVTGHAFDEVAVQHAPFRLQQGPPRRLRCRCTALPSAGTPYPAPSPSGPPPPPGPHRRCGRSSGRRGLPRPAGPPPGIPGRCRGTPNMANSSS